MDRHAAELSGLQSLIIGDKQDAYSPELLAAIAQLPELQALSVADSPFTDADLQQLSGLTQLARLDLEKTNVNNPAIWPAFPLTKLDLDDTLIKDEDAAALASYTNLEELSLKFTELTDNGFRELVALKRLKSLGLRGTRITYDTYETLCEFPELQDVILGVSPVWAGNAFSHWQVILADDEVGAAYGKWDDNTPIPFDREILRPSQSRIDDERASLQEEIVTAQSGSYPVLKIGSRKSLHLDLLRGVAGIKVLDLKQSLAWDQDLEVIATMPDLEVLILHDCWITDAGLRSLANCPKLRVLDLAGTLITDAGMSSVAHIKTLESLNLPSRTIGGTGLRELLKLPKLLCFGFTEYGDPWVRDARRRLAHPWKDEDLKVLGQLCKQLLARLDADGDGRATIIEIRKSDVRHFAGYGLL